MRIGLAAAMVLASLFSAACADEIDDYVLQEMEARRLPAVSFAIVRDSVVTEQRSYGLANLETGAPADNDTIYAIGSVTKSMTAVVVMMLVEDGLFSLDDAIGDHVAGLPRKWRRLKIRELLAHTTGLSGDFDNPCGHPSPAFGPFTARDRLKEIACLPLEGEPGAQFVYADPNYLLLGMAIESVSGKAYEKVVAERLFAPLGMTQSRFLDYRAVIAGRADGYEWGDDAYVNAESMDPVHEAPSGGILSTTGDVAKFVLALGDESLLSAEAWRILWTPPPIETPYALGFGVTPYEGRQRIGHNGAAVGFSWFPDESGGVVVLTNGYQAPFGRNIADFSFEIARLSGVFSAPAAGE